MKLQDFNKKLYYKNKGFFSYYKKFEKLILYKKQLFLGEKIELT